MNQIIHSLGGITIETGGTVLAHAAGYAVKSSRAVTAVRPYGSTEPGAANLSARHSDAYFAAGADKMGKSRGFLYNE
mgnify:CR=1 FL=1